LAGSHSGFQHYIVSAEATSIEFSGELLAMVVIGGMHHHILGPAVGVALYILFREIFSIWTGDWLFWFGLIFGSTATGAERLGDAGLPEINIR
jgi:branched-chain amino acid transport system ATP-binding protein